MVTGSGTLELLLGVHHCGRCAQVKRPSMKPARDANGTVGQQWQLPLAGSNTKRVTTDKKGNTAWVWDVTLSTETFALLTKEPRLRNLIVESAIEHIENTNQVKLERKYSCPKLRFKGTAENPDRPAVSVCDLSSLLCISFPDRALHPCPL